MPCDSEMASDRGDDDPLASLSDADLLSFGANLESELLDLEPDLERLQASLGLQRSEFRRTAGKLLVSLGLGVGGVFAAPLTVGLSLLLTIGTTLLLVWDAIELLGRLRDLRSEARQAATLSAEIERSVANLDSVWREMDRRSGG